MLWGVISEENSERALPISVVILAKNEAENLRECIESVAALAQEIVVVDDFSEDSTAEIAKSLGAKVFQHALNGDFSAQRKFALEKTTQPWVFFLDADERVPAELANEIRSCVSGDKKAAYEVTRLNHFKRERVRHGVLRPDRVLRLMPRDGIEIDGSVHEKISSPYPRARLREPLLHFTYEKWSAYFKKFENYTRIAAEKYYSEGKRVRFFRDIVLRPTFAFFKMYFLKGGFLDGKIGWILSANHFFYTQTKYVRLWSIEHEHGWAEKRTADGFHVLANDAECLDSFQEIQKILRERRGTVLTEKQSGKRKDLVLKAEIGGKTLVLKQEFFRFRFDRSVKAFLFGSDACEIFRISARARERGFSQIPQCFLAAEKFRFGILRESISATEFLDGNAPIPPIPDEKKSAIVALMHDCHAAGIISGDICPDNFIETPNDGWKLIDFRGNKVFQALGKARDRIQLEQLLGVPVCNGGLAEKIFRVQNAIRNLGRLLRGKTFSKS